MFGLFKKKKKTETTGKSRPKPSVVNDPYDMLKQATAQKKNGEIDKAIETLKNAYKAIDASGIEYTMDTYLRLPMYLQAASRSDEAWAEFNRLLTIVLPCSRSKALILMGHQSIYDKMRLFLQREKRFKEAVVQGVLSYLAVAQARYYQVREYKASQEELEQVKSIRSAEFIRKRLQPLLKKSGHLHLMEEVTVMIEGEFGEFPIINKTNIIEKLMVILSEGKS